MHTENHKFIFPLPLFYQPFLTMSETQGLNHTQEQTQSESSKLSHPLQRSGFDQGSDGTSLPPPSLGLGDNTSQNDAPIQRAVRVNGGSDQVNEADYQVGGPKEGVGARFPVRDLIADPVKRIFDSEAELEGYANGQTDYIGDVTTQNGATYWYRLPENQMTVLGEQHHNPDGNVEDVITGLNTSRFMYEPYHEFTPVGPFDQASIGNGTQTELNQNEAGFHTGGLVDRAHFPPHLENIVIKAMTGTSLCRNWFIDANPAGFGQAEIDRFSGRPTNSDYSIGDRIALYVSMAIHIAQDVAHFNFPEETMVDSLYFISARRLTEYYLANQADLDGLMATKDADDLIGIYELTQAGGFAILPMLREFTVLFHEYGSRYIEQLGSETGNAVLEAEGATLSNDLGAGLAEMNTAREEIMWERVMQGNGSAYLIAGMGDAHRQNFVARLAAEGIPQEEVVASLTRQQAENDANWTP